MTMTAQCLMSNCRNKAPDGEAMCSEHRDTDESEVAHLRRTLREIYEEWAGSEGFIPETAPEGYLLQLTKRMADLAASTFKENQP
jgi:hypothetical protein